MRLLAALILSLASAAFAQPGPPDASASPLAPSQLEAMMHTMRLFEVGKISVEGDVVDDEGKPVKDVTIKISADRYGADGRGNRVLLPSQVTNGTFKIAAEDLTGLHLEFVSDNYYARRLSFRAKEAVKDVKRWADDVRAGKGVHPELVKTGLKVVLDKHGPFQRLWPAEANTDVVLVFSPPIPGHTPAWRRPEPGQSDMWPYFGDCGIYDLTEDAEHPRGKHASVPRIDPQSLPAHCIYVDTLTENGIIATQRIKLLNKAGQVSREFDVPQMLRLVMKGPDGCGFTVVPAAREDRERQSQFMRQAPEAGYIKVITLDAKAIAALASAGSEAANVLHFYFKTDKYYGKAWITCGRVIEKQRRLEVYFAYQLQPNGSRDLTTP